MTRLEILIQGFCPDGVEYRSIGDCVQKTRNIQWATTEASYLYIDLTSVDRATHKIIETQTVNANNAPSRAQQIVLEGDVLFATTRPTLKRFCLINDKYDGQVCSTGFCVLRAKENIVIPQWLFHIVSCSEFYYYIEANQQGASYPAISDKMVKQFKIPVPPLPIQREIVRILDNFTELTEELTEELTARRKQYAYYRDTLFTFTSEIVFKTLPEISENCDRQRRPITKGNRQAGVYPYYGASGVVDHVADYIFDGDYLLVSEDGANLLARSTPIAFSISGKNWVNNHAHVLKFNFAELQKYVEIYLNSIDLSKYISGGAQPKLNQDNLNRIPIPVPSDDEVKRIVGVLTRFDTLCNDLTSGLPAEIEARQKQYEYYRDKLLTFKEASV